MEFGYWAIQGRGRPIRELLTYLKIDYHEYNPSSLEEWGKKKQEFAEKGYVSPNLPYIIDNGFYLSESRAIIQYLCYKANRTDLLGENAQHAVEVTMIIGILVDVQQALQVIATS